MQIKIIAIVKNKDLNERQDANFASEKDNQT